MNCKPGDLAIITQGRDSGKIVQCLHIASEPELKELHPHKDFLPVWAIDQHVRWHRPSGAKVVAPFCPDRLLKPLRDNPGEDEVLRLVGKPNEVKEITHV